MAGGAWLIAINYQIQANATPFMLRESGMTIVGAMEWFGPLARWGRVCRACVAAGVIALAWGCSGGDTANTTAKTTAKTTGSVNAAGEDSGAAGGAGVVNVYSARHYDGDQVLYDAFTQSTGIEVKLIEAASDALIARIKTEGEASPADVLITVDAGRLWRAEQQALFQPISSDVLDQRVPAHLRHPDGLWFGLTKRARVLIVPANEPTPDGLDSYADLADPAFAGAVCMRSSSNIYNQSLLAAQIHHLGADAAQAWADGVVSNFARPPKGNDTLQIEEVGAGVCGVSMVNSYYVARLRNSDDPEQQAKGEAVRIVFPDQAGVGTHVNVSGVGVMTHAPNRDNALAFIEFMTSDAAQNLLSHQFNEYPVVPAAEPADWVAALGDFVEDQLNASVLGTNQAQAVAVFDRAGWD